MTRPRDSAGKSTTQIRDTQARGTVETEVTAEGAPKAGRWAAAAKLHPLTPSRLTLPAIAEARRTPQRQ
jgi:hypothetical protein